MPISKQHLAELAKAKALLEIPGLAAKASNLIGKPLEKGFQLLPADWGDKISVATREALLYALKGSLLTMDETSTEAYPRLAQARCRDQWGRRWCIWSSSATDRITGFHHDYVSLNR